MKVYQSLSLALMVIPFCILPSCSTTPDIEEDWWKGKAVWKKPFQSRISHNAAVAAYKSGDFEKALEILLPQGEKGNPRAQSMLGDIYEKHVYGPGTNKIAREWWKRAARGGDFVSMYKLSRPPFGELQGPNEMYWLEKSANLGMQTARLELGAKYLLSEKFEDQVKGWVLLRVASSTGSRESIEDVTRLFQKSVGDRKYFNEGYVNKLDDSAIEGLLSVNKGHLNTGIVSLPERPKILLYNLHGRLLGLLESQKTIKTRKIKPSSIPSKATLKTLGDDFLSKRWPLLARAHPFVLYSEKLAPDGPEVVPVKNEELWYLLLPGDHVLLTDRVTHHVSTVFSIDHERQFVQFLDPWPEPFFLKDGMNVLGIDAKTVPYGAGNKLMQISQQEFLQVARGIYALRSPNFPNEYFEMNSRPTCNAEVHNAFGESLIKNPKLPVAQSAESHFREALESNSFQGNKVRLLVNHALALYYQSFPETLNKRVEGQAVLEALSEDYGQEWVDQCTCPKLIAKVAGAKQAAGEMESAVEFADLAFNGDTREPIPFVIWGKINLQAKRYDEVILGTTLIVNSAWEELNKLETLSVPANTNREIIEDAENLIAMLFAALQFRAKASSELELFENAIADGILMVRLDPTDISAHQMLVDSYEKVGDSKKAEEHLTKMRELLRGHEQLILRNMLRVGM